MQTKDMLVLESAGKGRIVLHKEGIFWRAYQYSAYLFSKHIRPLKVNTKLVKAVDTEIAYLGFPEKVLEEALQLAGEKGWSVEKEEKLIKIGIGEAVSPEAFQAWIPKPGKEHEGPSAEEVTEGSDSYDEVIRKLRSYPILEKSPLETQQFVLHLQKQIHGLA
jgi:hypothetical protein